MENEKAGIKTAITLIIRLLPTQDIQKANRRVGKNKIDYI
jgi:hypothetical protein